MEEKCHIRIASEEHLQEEFKAFSNLRRKIRKWLKDEDKNTHEIYNIFIGIVNVFKLPFIKETITDRFNIEEREIVFAMMKYHKAENLK